jgi:hypothetical protein
MWSTIAGVLSQKEREPVAGDLQEDREARLEPVFPIDLESRTVAVELLARRVISDSEGGHDAALDFEHRPLSRSSTVGFP